MQNVINSLATQFGMNQDLLASFVRFLNGKTDYTEDDVNAWLAEMNFNIDFMERNMMNVKAKMESELVKM